MQPPPYQVKAPLPEPPVKVRMRASPATADPVSGLNINASWVDPKLKVEEVATLVP